VKKKITLVFLALFGAFALVRLGKTTNWNPKYKVGQVVDELDGVKVYYNGGVRHTAGRSLAPDGYNLGLKYQCVEFVKRYYYKRYGHKMPDAYGHAKDFFDPALGDGQFNAKRGLMQYRNGSGMKPCRGDLIIFKPTFWNKFGHVAIVSEIRPDFVEIIQQNPGPFGRSRERFRVLDQNKIENERIVGWLRK
jgi:surface antigen